MECPKRKTIRLQEYDYSSPGAYFVTICTQGKRCILSDIIVGDGVLDVPQVRLTKYGAIVEQTLQEINRTYAHISIERYVIMPNHVHMLVHIEENGTSRTPSPTDEIENSTNRANAVLPLLISTFKRFTNKKCGAQLWQRSYHEHVIRNERDCEEIWRYIENNPTKWAEDRYYTE